MISEIDIQDWEMTEPIPLYQVKRNTYIDVNGVKLFFDHLDGMYSYCITMNNEVVHIGATTVVRPLRKKE